MKQKLLPIFVLLVLTVVFWFSFDFGPREELPSAMIGKPFPKFELPDLERSVNVTEEVVRGQNRLVNVWGTWCLACKVEHPFLLELSEKGVSVVGLNYDDVRQEALDWLMLEGDPYDFVIVMDRPLRIDLGVIAAPETFLVDAEGTIRAKHVGTLSESVWQRKFARYF